ncbi:MAG: hypothetical protein R3B46_05320 [Phycisphaerales bacterium]
MTIMRPMDGLHEERRGGIVSREEREMDADERVEAPVIEAEAGAQQIAVAVEEQGRLTLRNARVWSRRSRRRVVHEMDNESRRTPSRTWTPQRQPRFCWTWRTLGLRRLSR